MTLSSRVQDRVNAIDEPRRSVAWIATPPPANQVLLEKNPLDVNTRTAPCETSALTGNPNAIRLWSAGSASMALSPKTRTMGDTVSLMPDPPVSRAILALMYEVPIRPAGPLPSELPTTRGTVAPI